MFGWLQNGFMHGVTFATPEAALYVTLAIGAVVAGIIPYLLGSINSAVLISRLFYGADIRTQGSGNGGLTNMHRVYGTRAALFVLVGDVLKMAVSLLIVGAVFGMHYGVFKDATTGQTILGINGFGNTFATQPLLSVAGTSCIIGHIFPIYFKFKGGKGVLCTAAMVLILSPFVFLALFLVFLLLLCVTHYVSLASMTVGLFYPFVLDRLPKILCGVSPTGSGITPLLAIVIGLLILYCHRGNIVRLKEKRENKFYFRKSKRP
jgi:glycerol-3-phosphate acyltransferase PlsY